MAGLVALLLPDGADAASVTVRPSKDTTILGSGDRDFSDGASAYLLAGYSGENRKLRSLLAFTLAVPMRGSDGFSPRTQPAEWQAGIPAAALDPAGNPQPQ